MKRILFLITLIFSFVCLTGCSTAKWNEEKGVLRVGLECAYAPFNWTETEKTDDNVPIKGTSMYADGYDIQMAKLIAEDMGCELEIHMIEWDGLVVALKSGKIDLIIAGMSPTEERKKSISFTDAYYTSKHVLVMANDSEYVNAKTFADLDDAKIIGQASTVYDKLADQICDKNKNAKYQNPLDNVPAIIYAIKSGTVDITVLEEPVAKGVVASNPEFTYITLEEEFELEEADKVVSIGVRKNDTRLLELVNASLAKISTETREQLMEAAVNQGE